MVYRGILATTAVVLLSSIRFSVAQTQITINTASLLQEIDGFGVSQAFTRAREFEQTAAEPRQKGLDYLFNIETGAGLTIIRNRIGSSTNDTILPQNPGGPNGTPKWVWDGSDSSQIWFSKEARKYGVTTIYADAWSAPGYMKTNNNEVNGGYLCGVTGRSCSSGDWRQMYATYLTQYAKYYEQEGVPVTHIGFLNEPDYVYVNLPRAFVLVPTPCSVSAIPPCNLTATKPLPSSRLSTIPSKPPISPRSPVSYAAIPLAGEALVASLRSSSPLVPSVT